MTNTRLHSSSLALVTYQAELQLLQVEFVSAEVYRYLGVPETVYHGLLDADSKGRYFNQHIRNQFPHEKLPPGQKLNGIGL